jgi:hypothetical protein
MGVYPTVRAGMKVTQARLSAMQWNETPKVNDQGVANSTTYVDDTALLFAVAANAEYVARFHLVVDGVTGADIKVRFSVPAGATGFRWCQGPQAGSADRENTNMAIPVHGFTTDRPYGTVAATAASIAVIERLHVFTAATSGSVTLQWAQNTANATGTLVLANSFVTWLRVG